jgi:Na+-driven multidrug efflux pump
MKTDRLEFWVRFVCGALFGLLVGLYIAFNLLEGPVVVALGITLGVALGFGVAAVRYGDRFWQRTLRILRSLLTWS